MNALSNLYCPKCKSKIYSKGEKMMEITPFTGTEERCSNCNTVLRRRSPGGQSDTWNFITTVAESTLNSHLAHIVNIAEHIKRKHPEELTTLDINSFVEDIKKILS